MGRHDAVKTIIAGALAVIASTDIRVEPRILEGQRRNDIAVVSGRRVLDYDLKIYTLHHAKANSTTIPKPETSTVTPHAFDQSVRYLDRGDSAATNCAPDAVAEFPAIVLSTGELLSTGTSDELSKWKREIGAGGYEKLKRRIVLKLLKSRSRLFEM